MFMRMWLSQAIGLVGIALVLLGGLISNVFPQIGPTSTSYGAGLPLFLIGSVVVWIGILGSWVQGIARATRAWDEVRKEYGFPPK